MSYEKDGEKYYIVDAHSHFWDASRENWKPGVTVQPISAQSPKAQQCLPQASRSAASRLSAAPPLAIKLTAIHARPPMTCRLQPARQSIA